MFNKSLAALAAAWNLLIDIPLPKSLRVRADDMDEDGPELTALAFPVVGLLSGLVLFIVGWLLSELFQRSVGAALFGVIAVLLSESRDSGRGFSLAVSYADNLSEGMGLAGSLQSLESDWRRLSGFAATLAGVLLLGVKIFCFRELFLAGAWSWVMGIFVLGAASQGYLSSCRSLYSGESFLAVTGSARHHIWLVAVFIMLFYISNPAAVLLSLLVAVLGSVLFGRWCEDRFHGLDAMTITLFGFWVELAVLLLGVLTLH